MKITIQEGKRRVEVDCDNETIHDVIDELHNLLIAWGFHPESVKKGILEKAAEYEENERDN